MLHAPTDIWGVWLTNVDSQVLFSEQAVKDSLQQLAAGASPYSYQRWHSERFEKSACAHGANSAAGADGPRHGLCWRLIFVYDTIWTVAEGETSRDRAQAIQHLFVAPRQRPSVGTSPR